MADFIGPPPAPQPEPLYPDRLNEGAIDPATGQVVGTSAQAFQYASPTYADVGINTEPTPKPKPPEPPADDRHYVSPYKKAEEPPPAPADLSRFKPSPEFIQGYKHALALALGVGLGQTVVPPEKAAPAPPNSPTPPAGSLVFPAATTRPAQTIESKQDDLLSTLLQQPQPGAAKSWKAYEQPLADPKRQAVEQAAYGSVQKAIGNEADAVEGEKSAERNLGAARGGVNEAKAEGWRGVAKAAEDAVWDIRARAAESKSRSDAYLKRLEAFSEDLANDKIDPNAQWNNASTGRQITWTLAKMFGAIQQGALGLPSNQVADRLDAMAKADVDAQKANHSIKRGRLEDMQNLFSLALKQTKDENEAAVLAHGYALEAAKAEAMALGDAAGTPVAKAEAEKLVAALGEKQAQLGQKIAENGVAAVQRGIAENKFVPAGSTGGVGAGLGLTDKDRHTLLMKMLEHKLDADKNRAEHQANAEVKRQSEIEQIQTTISEQDKQFANLMKHPAIEKLGWSAALANKLGSVGQRVAPDSALVATQVDGLNQMILGSVGKQLKDTEGRISPPILEALHKLQILPSDTPQTALEKIRQANNFVDEAARQGGGSAPEPNKGMPSYFRAPGSGPEAKAKGGKVGTAKPYLVGEKGPELVVPDQDGFVLTALQTAALRGAPPTKQQLDSLPRREEGGPVSYLYEPPGAQLHVGDDGRAFYASTAPSSGGASLSAPAPRYSSAPPARPAPARPAQRQMTHDEMLREADRMIAQTKAQTAAAEARGPAVQLERRDEGGPYGPAAPVLPVVADAAPPAQTWGYTPDTGDVGQDASQMVDAQRNAGGYAQLDMTPIPTPPQGSGTYESQDDIAKRQSFEGALAASGEGADPYQRAGRPEAAPQDRAASNAEAAAETRKRFETGGDQYDPSLGSVGDRAKKSGAEKKADKGSILKQIFQAIASSGHPPPDESTYRSPYQHRAWGGPMMASQQAVRSAAQAPAPTPPPQPQGPPITPYSGMTGSTGLGRAGTPAYPPAYPQRAFGGPMHVSTKQTGVGDMSAGELGMNGVGGLVSGNIDRANQDVSDEMHQAGGVGMRANGGPMVAPTSREIFQKLARSPVVQPAAPADPAGRAGTGDVAPTSREIFQKLARSPVVQPRTPADASRQGEPGAVAPTSQDVFAAMARAPVVQPREEGGPVAAPRTWAHFLTPGQRAFLKDPYEGGHPTFAHFLPPAVRRAITPAAPPAPPPHVPHEDKVASAGVFDAMEKGSADRASREYGGPVRGGKTKRRG